MKPRPIRIEGDLAFIVLTRGLEATIDAADVHLVDGWNWSISGASERSKLKVIRSDRKKTIYMHRVLVGSPQGVHVDHANGDSLDNRRANLVISSGAFSKPPAQGLLWHEPGSRWQLEIRRGAASTHPKKPDQKKVVWAFGAPP